jgi:hypothetical protein
LGKLEQDLTRHATVGVDTAPFIYLWERHPRYFVPSETLFRHLKKPQVKGITSVIFSLLSTFQTYPVQEQLWPVEGRFHAAHLLAADG